MTTLEDLTRAAREQVARRREQVSLEELERAISARVEGRPFNEALVRPESERDEAPSRQGGFLNRRRDRQRAQLRAACAERAGAA